MLLYKPKILFIKLNKKLSRIIDKMLGGQCLLDHHVFNSRYRNHLYRFNNRIYTNRFMNKSVKGPLIRFWEVKDQCRPIQKYSDMNVQGRHCQHFTMMKALIKLCRRVNGHCLRADLTFNK